MSNVQPAGPAAYVRYVLLKLLVKCTSLAIWLFTRLKYGFFPKDPTLILLDLQSPSQRAAQEKLKRIILSPVPVARTKVLIVVPFRDRWQLTHRCLDSLLAQQLADIEIVVALVDNDSVEPVTALGLAEYLMKFREAGISARLIKETGAFNFSRINNSAVAKCASENAEFILFLNNDIEMETKNALSRMIAFLQTVPDAGALGCTLLYPTRLIQHLFLAPGVKLGGAHPGRSFRYDSQFSWFLAPRPVAAVTGAVFLLRAEDFKNANGFCEKLATGLQDLDLCLKLLKSGKINWVLPDVLMTHHENATRSSRLSFREMNLIYSRWGDFLTDNDYFSSRLSRWTEVPCISLGEGRFPWKIDTYAMDP